MRKDRKEKYLSMEARTQAFFNKPADEVVKELAEKVRETDEDNINYSVGTPKFLQVGTKKYKIKEAEAYLEKEAGKIWQNKRIEAIKALASGEMIAFQYRTSVLPFIKARSGDNILIRSLEDTDTGEIIGNPTEVSKILKLTHNDEGRLTFVDPDTLRFEKL